MSADVTQKAGFVHGVHLLRAVAALGVVIYHAGGSIGSSVYQNLHIIKAVTIGLDVGVNLFFVISGFVIALPLFLGRRSKLVRFFSNRVLRIYPMSALTAVIFLGFGWLVFGRVPSTENILSSVFLLPIQTPPTPSVLWTLKQEFLFYAIFSLAFVRIGPGLALVALWAVLSPLIAFQSALGDWLFNPQNVQFGCGVLAAWIYVRRPPTQFTGLALLASAPPLLLWLAYARRLTDFPDGLAAVMLGVFGLGTVLGAAVTVRRPGPRLAVFLGSASYSIYLIHYFFISLTQKALMAIAPEVPGGVALLVLVTAATAFGGVYYIVFETQLETLRRRIATRQPISMAPRA